MIILDRDFAAMPWQNIRYFDHPHSGQGPILNLCFGGEGEIVRKDKGA